MKTVFTSLMFGPESSVWNYKKIHFSGSASRNDELSTDSYFTRQIISYDLRMYLQIVILKKIVFSRLFLGPERSIR